MGFRLEDFPAKTTRIERPLRYDDIHSSRFPLMPLDFSLWHEVEQKVLAKDVKGKGSKKAYSARVRETALKLPASVIKKCLASMKKRIKATEEAKGKYTSMD